MAQHAHVALPVKHYTRADFTALRAFLNKLPVERIASLYYSEDDLERFGCERPGDLRRRIEDLRDELIARAIDANPLLAKSLQEARQNYRWSAAAIDFLVRAADQAGALPQPTDPCSVWFRPILALRLKAENIVTLGQLVARIRACGAGWFHPVPQLGQKKADALVRWLRDHGKALESLPANLFNPGSERADIVVLDPDRPEFLPIERLALPEYLAGTRGINRNHDRCLIAARDDLQAAMAYLHRFREQPPTLRAYRREIERFLLWCALVRRAPLSSLLGSDCDMYKDFLANPPSDWIGPRVSRHSATWKPFAGLFDDRLGCYVGNPNPDSQRHAVNLLTAFFTWLVNVRYLASNPWMTILKPKAVKKSQRLQIDRALPEALWNRLANPGGLLDQLCETPQAEFRQRYRLRGWSARMDMPAQWRLLRAAILLMGNSGLRREEAASATRDRLEPLREAPVLWELAVIGKGDKLREVLVPVLTVDALRAHWADRQADFDFRMAMLPLLAPLIITAGARDRHQPRGPREAVPGFTPDSLYQLVKRSLVRIAEDEALCLDADERHLLKTAAPHAFRHTFGTLTVAGDLPLDVLQQLLGHESLTTTTIYVRAEKKRRIAEVGKYFLKKRGGSAED